MATFDFEKKITKKTEQDFADMLKAMSEKIGFKVSSRGWCYLMEQAGYITKDGFGKVEDAINRLRRKGVLPVDFVAEEDARQFSGVVEPNNVNAVLRWMLKDVLNGFLYYEPEWWEGEQYYIQILVEKIDLKTLFQPVCEHYKIPIANAKGWSSILQRAEYCRRFAEAEAQGLTCVLLYCGDHDPDGLRISDTIRANLEQISGIEWNDGFEGYNPENLIIERFGLNYDFIIDNGYTWIDNLITGSGSNLASTSHPNNKLPYVRDYLREIGERKCEANAIVTTPREAKRLIEDAIHSYLGEDAKERFDEKRRVANELYVEKLDKLGVKAAIEAAIQKIDNG